MCNGYMQMYISDYVAIERLGSKNQNKQLPAGLLHRYILVSLYMYVVTWIYILHEAHEIAFNSPEVSSYIPLGCQATMCDS